MNNQPSRTTRVEVDEAVKNTAKWVTREVEKPVAEQCMYLAEMITAFAQLLSAYAILDY